VVRAEPQTGRTHQLRLQLAFQGHPILGDPLYGAGPAEHIHRTMLHAEALSITHPVRKEELCIKAELFEDMARIMREPAEQCCDLAKTAGSG
jgi:23S rRNA pseudouridine1911/1915/1917 synthase